MTIKIHQYKFKDLIESCYRVANNFKLTTNTKNEIYFLIEFLEQIEGEGSVKVELTKHSVAGGSDMEDYDTMHIVNN